MVGICKGYGASDFDYFVWVSMNTNIIYHHIE